MLKNYSSSSLLLTSLKIVAHRFQRAREEEAALPLFLLLLLLLLLFYHNYSSGYTECGVSIIFSIVIVNDSVCPCLPVTDCSHKLSGDLLQQHFVMS